MQDNNNELMQNDNGNNQELFHENGYIPLKDNEVKEQSKQRPCRNRRNNILLLVIVALILMGTSSFFEGFSLFTLDRNINLSKDVSNLSSGELVLNARNGFIAVEGYDGKEIIMNVKYQTKMFLGGRDLNLTINKDGETIYLDYDRNKIGGLSIEAQIPKGIFKHINIKSSNGRLEMDGLDSHTAQLETSNAKVNVEEWMGEKLIIQTSNGLVELEDTLGEEIEVKTSNAKINLDNVEGKDTILKTSNGEINIELGKFNSYSDYRWELDTSNGRVNLDLPDEREIGYKLYANTSNSIIAHNLENFSADKNTEKLLSGETGNYNTAKVKAEIEIETSNAQITIE